MVDIHCHILPELDDGAVAEDVAVEMARMSAADGITHVVATPHSNYRYRFDPEVNRQKRDALQQVIGEKPALLLGCDFHLSYENLEDVRTHPTRYSVNATQYLLVEFADIAIPPHMEQIFFDLLAHKLAPIITHPERNPLLSKNAELLSRWIAAGCFVPVTAGSLLGRFGKRARESAWSLLRHGMVHFIASDAHDTKSRPPLLSEAREAIRADQGDEAAEALSESNPRAVIEGRPLPWRPDPQQVRPRSWLSFLHR